MPLLGSIESFSPESKDNSYVQIKKANNGFIVNSFDNNGPKSFVAKTKKEAKNIAEKQISKGMSASNTISSKKSQSKKR